MVFLGKQTLPCVGIQVKANTAVATGCALGKKGRDLYTSRFFYLTLFRQAALISDRAKLLNLPCWDECEWAGVWELVSITAVPTHTHAPLRAHSAGAKLKWRIAKRKKARRASGHGWVAVRENLVCVCVPLNGKIFNYVLIQHSQSSDFFNETQIFFIPLLIGKNQAWLVISRGEIVDCHFSPHF